MAKYKQQFHRKFDMRSAVITGFSANDYCATLSFDQVPQTVLAQIASELVNDGYCSDAEVESDRIELIEPDMMMCELDGLKRFLREMLGEINYELEEG